MCMPHVAHLQIFRLSFGPKSFVIISDPAYAKQILLTNADKYSKGLLSEILVRVVCTPKHCHRPYAHCTSSPDALAGV